MDAAPKKHPCPDCRQCQWCSDDRCRLCLRSGCRKKLSMAEQIALYEQLNETPDECGTPPMTQPIPQSSTANNSE